MPRVGPLFLCNACATAAARPWWRVLKGSSVTTDLEWLKFINETIGQIRAAFAELLQSKHLYQSVQGPEAPAMKDVSALKAPEQYRVYDSIQSQQKYVNGPWFVFDPAAPPGRRTEPETAVNKAVVAPTFRPPDVKLYCR